MMKTLARWGYPPLMLLGINGAAFELISRHAPHFLLAGLLVAAIGVSYAVERLIPYEEDWNRSHGDTGRDAMHAFVNETSALLAVLALPVLASVATLWDAWPAEAPFVLQVVGAILVFDLGITVCHWLSHRWGPLWRLHAVHHSVTRSYGLNGLMKHPLHQAAELTFGIAPLLVIGITKEVAWALAFCVAIQLLMQHSNADYRVGPLRSVLALNEGHRFHHLRWAGVGDVNFGLFTLLWDHVLLRSFSYDPERRFTSADLGIAKEPDFPAAYFAQLAKPWRGG
jgi:sterol desaturase/sphingolipid hydroxylase (fatty acid hydroxylase superfamily)